jgi:hypothetical protein
MKQAKKAKCSMLTDVNSSKKSGNLIESTKIVEPIVKSKHKVKAKSKKIKTNEKKKSSSSKFAKDLVNNSLVRSSNGVDKNDTVNAKQKTIDMS